MNKINRLIYKKSDSFFFPYHFPALVTFCHLALLLISVIFFIQPCLLHSEDKTDDGSVKGWFKPKIYIYQPPPVEISTSPVFRTVDPQIIQKLIDLLQENNLGKEEKQDDQDNKSIGELLTYLTPEGRELQDRYTRLGVTLSEALGWEQIKHIRVISEQNLKQRLTTVARWDSSPNVRCIALVSLATLKDQNDLVYFQEALWSRNIGVRYATVEALLKWGYPDAIPLLKNLVEKDESLLIKVVAASALARLGSPEGIVTLRVNINHADWFVRALCAKALGEVGNWEDYDLLVNQINREQNSNTNDFVLAEISISALKLFPQKIEKEKEERELKKKKNVPAPQPEIKKEKPKPRNDVLFELEPLVVTAPRLKIQQGELVDSRVNFQLLKLLQDKAEERITTEMDTQSSAFRDLNALVTPNGIRLKSRYTILGLLLTEGLAGTNDFQLKDALMRIIREDIPLQAENKIVKSFALIALAFCKDLSHLSLFQNALRSESSAERFAAIEALGIWGYREASTILVGVTKLDRSPMIRVYAAQQVLRLGDLMGKDYLITALNDEDWIARAMSMRYLGEMGGAEDYNKILSYFGLQQKDIVQAEMCSALLRLHAKKYESENK